MINDQTLITMDRRNVVFSVVQDRYITYSMSNHWIISFFFFIDREKKKINALIHF
jgi:hypothetical protein